MNDAPKRKTIGSLARQSGVGIDTVRFYERAGLIPKAVRTPSGYRTYTEADVDRLRFIRRANELGFSLDEVDAVLGTQETRSCQQPPARRKTAAPRRSRK